MESTDRIINRVLTGIKEQQTKGEPTSTITPQRKIDGFETFGDKPGDDALARMLFEAEKFLAEICERKPPRWLSFCGTSGAGKTFLAEKVVRLLPRSAHQHRDLIDGVESWKWVILLKELRDKKFSLLNDVRDANVLLLDDIGASSDTSFAMEQLYLILEMRNRKWTLLTSNLGLRQIAERIDTRISSRLVRDQNVCVEVNVIDYALRKQP